MTPLRISTRGSLLALWQAEWVAAHLNHPATIHTVRSTGDKLLNVALQGRDDQGFFTKEIERAVLDGRADLAVHSLKDLPTQVADGLALVAVPEREIVEDVFLVHPDKVRPERLLPVAEGGVVGATSLRRQALLRHFSPDLQPTLLRGNVPTRLERLRRGEFDAILLARAGLRRLQAEIDGFKAYALDPTAWFPAPGQAALGIEARPGTEAARIASEALDHEPSHRAVDLERRLMALFEAGCHAPFAAWATIAPTGETTLRLGCATDAATWAAVTLTLPSEQGAEEAAMAALESAIRAPQTHVPPTKSPCVQITSF